MNKSNDNKKIFNGEGVAEFEEFVDIFHVEANKRGCDQHFNWEPEDISKEDKSVPEEIFPYKRICDAGKEEEFARKKLDEKLQVLDEKYLSQLSGIRKVYVGNRKVDRKVKELELKTKWEDAKASLEVGFDKTVHDLRAACDLHDRKEKLFDDAKAQAVSLLYNWLGSSSFSTIQEKLKTHGPKNAFKVLVDLYAAEADSNQYLSIVLSRMSSLVFSSTLGGGKVSDHLAFLDKLNSVLVKKGKGLSDGSILGYLLDSIKRNKDALALYADGLTSIFNEDKTRQEAIKLLTRIEHAHEVNAELSGKRTNFAGAQFARVQGAFAGTASVNQAKGDRGKRKHDGGGKEGGGVRECSRCGSSDHLRKDCHEEVFCQTCNKNTHSEKCCWTLHPEKIPPKFKRAKVGKNE